MRVLLKEGGRNKDAGERSRLEQPLSSGPALWSIDSKAREHFYYVPIQELLALNILFSSGSTSTEREVNNA